MPRPALVVVLAFALLLPGCTRGEDGGDADGTPPARSDRPVATFDTSLGGFEVELNPADAPVTVANFLQYADSGFYDGTIFHRIVKKSADSCIGVIQGGGFVPDPAADAKMAEKNGRGPIPLESPPGASHVAGVIAMARTNDPNSATSQFFIDVEESTCLDRQPGYAIFGRVLAGMDVVRTIQGVATTTRGSYADAPVEDVVVESVTVEYPEDAEAAILLAPFRSAYNVSVGRESTLPLLVQNAGTGPGTVTLRADPTPEGTTVTFHGPDARPVSVSPGAFVVVVVKVAAADVAWETADLGITAAEEGTLAVTPATIHLTRAAAAERRADRDTNNLTQVRYIGVYDNAFVFDSNELEVWESEVTPHFPTYREHLDPLKVFLGTGRPAEPGYSPVIPGFSDLVVGLAPGETATARVPPEAAYRDGYHRIFEVTLVTIDP